MPEAGWLPLQSDPIGSCDFSKVALPDCFPLVIGGEKLVHLYIACPLAQGLEPTRNSYTQDNLRKGTLKLPRLVTERPGGSGCNVTVKATR